MKRLWKESMAEFTSRRHSILSHGISLRTTLLTSQSILRTKFRKILVKSTITKTIPVVFTRLKTSSHTMSFSNLKNKLWKQKIYVLMMLTCPTQHSKHILVSDWLVPNSSLATDTCGQKNNCLIILAMLQLELGLMFLNHLLGLVTRL